MSNEVEEIDVTKTLIFLLVSLFVTLVITAAMIIHDIKALKIKKIKSDKKVFDKLVEIYTSNIPNIDELNIMSNEGHYQREASRWEIHSK